MDTIIPIAGELPLAAGQTTFDGYIDDSDVTPQNLERGVDSESPGYFGEKSDGRHIYRQLKDNEIRILEILPGPEDDTIKTRLKYIKLAAASGYFALSYAWGDLTKPKPCLLVNGHTLHVTESCILALGELRRESMAYSKPFFIWIDAICIDQTDIPERNKQLLIMRQIYSGATKLIIWLGPERHRSNEAIEIMKNLANASSKGEFEQWRERCEKHPQYLRRWLSITSFFSRSWFTRVWIIQEYLACSEIKGGQYEDLASETIEFYCGASRVSPVVLYEVIHHGFKWLQLHPPKIDARVTEQIQPLLISSRRGLECFHEILYRAVTPIYIKPNAAASQLIRHILQGLACDATDPRDRIYAHLPLQSGWTELPTDPRSVEQMSNQSGLSHDACIEYLAQFYARISISLSKLIVDYDSSVEDVYSSLVRYMEFATGRLNILSLCHKRGSDVKRTWTLDLTAMPFHEDGYTQEAGLLMRSFLETPDRESCASKSFNACNGAAADAKFSPDLSLLSVKGFRAATIVVPIYGKFHGQDFWLAFCLRKQNWNQILSLMANMRAYKTHESRQKALWNTVLGVKSYEDEPDLFRRWCAWLDTDANNLDFWDRTVCYQLDRRLFLASNGKIGKGWDTVAAGDLICVILGCDVPLVLRPTGAQYELIGDCYIDGIMEGQAMKDVEEGKVGWEIFDLQ